MSINNVISMLRQCEVSRALNELRGFKAIQPYEVDKDDTCPICLLQFDSILIDEIKEDENRKSSSSQPTSDESEMFAGVVKLDGCGHVFCRKDLAEWIKSLHGSCPTCRQVFFKFTPMDEMEYESSDGGEYLPEEDDDDDEFYTEEEDIFPSSDIDYEGVEESDADEPRVAQLLFGIQQEIERSMHDETVDPGLTDDSDPSYSSEGNSITIDERNDTSAAYAGDISMMSTDADMTDGDEEIVASILISEKPHEPVIDGNFSPQRTL